jgi:hypothetical protein
MAQKFWALVLWLFARLRKSGTAVKPKMPAGETRANGYEVIIHDGDEYESTTEAERTAALISNLKEEAQYTRDDLQRAYRRIEKLEVDLAQTQQRESSKHGQLLQAESEMQHLHKCLDDCKDRIFKTQPMEHMTDAQVVEEYVTLCEAMSDWTDQQFGELDDPFETIDEVMQRGTNTEVIEEYLVSTGGLDIARTHPLSGCIVLTSFLHLFLHQVILQEKIFFPGLILAWESFVSFMKGGMSTLQPTRGEFRLCGCFSAVADQMQTTR